jgi:hypothetical protein
MSAPIGPGDWIECVGPFEGNGAGLAARYRALGYTIVGAYHVGLLTICTAVTSAMRLPDGRIVPGLQTRDVKAFRSGREVWLPAYQWRPVYRPKSEFIESLKQPSPEREAEHV